MTLKKSNFISGISDSALSDAALSRFQEVCKSTSIPLSTFSKIEFYLTTQMLDRESVLENNQYCLRLLVVAKTEGRPNILTEFTAEYANEDGYEAIRRRRIRLREQLNKAGSIQQGLRGEEIDKSHFPERVITSLSHQQRNERNIKPGSIAWIKHHPTAIPFLLKALQGTDKKSRPEVLVKAANDFEGSTDQGSASAIRTRGLSSLSHLREKGYIESIEDEDGNLIFTKKGNGILEAHHNS